MSFSLVCISGIKKLGVHRCMDSTSGLQFDPSDQHVCICFYFYSSVVQFEITDGQTSSNSFIFKGCLRFPRFLFVCFCMNLKIVLSRSAKEMSWNFIGDYIKSVGCFWYHRHFCINPTNP